MLLNSLYQNKSHFDPEFQNDLHDLFFEKRQGHMEKWEYSTALYSGDPSSGMDAWAELTKNPKDYYLINGDIHNVQDSVKNPFFLKALEGITNLIELGPGCKKSLLLKTLPIIKVAKSLLNYQVIDGTYDVAQKAGNIITANSNLKAFAQSYDFIQNPIKKLNSGKTALIFWGGSIGNFSGFMGDNAFQKLVKQLHNFQQSLEKGDLVILSFDAEENKQKVIAAYKEENLRKQILSVLFKAKRDGILSSGFNPYMWKNEPVWVESVKQCAHTIYPVINQEFKVGNKAIFVPQGKRFVSNNSYKYHPDTMISAASMAGFSKVSAIKNNSMALLIAEK